jgi:hypothetical protein
MDRFAEPFGFCADRPAHASSRDAAADRVKFP